MNEVVPFLYLGSHKEAENTLLLEANGIRAIVGCFTIFEFMSAPIPEGFEYHPIYVEDSSREPIHIFFNEAIDYIDWFISRKEAVLVHCKAGVSRSATIILAYMMKKQRLKLQEAFFHLRSKRPKICPNLGFMEQLCDYERQLFGKTSIDILKYSDWFTSPSEFRAAIPDLDP